MEQQYHILRQSIGGFYFLFSITNSRTKSITSGRQYTVVHMIYAITMLLPISHSQTIDHRIWYCGVTPNTTAIGKVCPIILHKQQVQDLLRIIMAAEKDMYIFVSTILQFLCMTAIHTQAELLRPPAQLVQGSGNSYTFESSHLQCSNKTPVDVYTERTMFLW